MGKIIKEQTWIAAGKVMEFDGFLRLRDELDEDVVLPSLDKDAIFNSKEFTAKQNFTKPPARYTEATLVKTLEQKGIGRPSTYASTIATIQDRNYVVKEDNKLKPTEMAYGVNDFLETHFHQLMDYDFTAEMENKLDDVANGDLERKKMLQDFYAWFEPQLIDSKWSERITLTTGKPCPKCWEGELIVRYGKSKTSFLGCSRYPECDYVSETEDVSNKLNLIKEKYEGQPCPAGGTIVVKMGRFWPFLCSSDYPTIKWIKSPVQFELELKLWDNKPACPECGAEMTIRRSKRGAFWGCSKYPDCKGIVNIK